MQNPLQEKAYQALSTLGVAFERVDNSPAASMEDCHVIGEKLNTEVVKNIFLCNRQQTVFYLFITRSDKPFSTKDFGRALQISRVSFAPADKLMEMLGAEHGAATVFCLLMDTEHKVRYIIDKDVLDKLDSDDIIVTADLLNYDVEQYPSESFTWSATISFYQQGKVWAVGSYRIADSLTPTVAESEAPLTWGAFFAEWRVMSYLRQARQ